MTWLLRLYPRTWQERYGQEVAALLSEEPRSLRLAVDLIAGAVDARLHPQPLTKGAQMSTPLFRCQPVALTRADAWKGNIVIVGGTLVIAALYLAGRRGFPGANPYIDTLGYSAFSLPLVVSSYWTYLKPYPPPVRVALVATTSLVMLAILFAATALAIRL